MADAGDQKKPSRIRFGRANFPYAIFAALHASNDKAAVPTSHVPGADASVMNVNSGEFLRGEGVICKYITSALSSSSPFMGSDLSAAQSCEVDTYMDLAASYDAAAITPLLDHLNSRLALRTFIVGHSSTLADLLCWAALKRRDFAPAPSHPHLSRWFSFISAFPGNSTPNPPSLPASYTPFHPPLCLTPPRCSVFCSRAGALLSGGRRGFKVR
jgi:hypothetical protein